MRVWKAVRKLGRGCYASLVTYEHRWVIRYRKGRKVRPRPGSNFLCADRTLSDAKDLAGAGCVFEGDAEPQRHVLRGRRGEIIGRRDARWPYGTVFCASIRIGRRVW